MSFYLFHSHGCSHCFWLTNSLPTLLKRCCSDKLHEAWNTCGLLYPVLAKWIAPSQFSSILMLFIARIVQTWRLTTDLASLALLYQSLRVNARSTLNKWEVMCLKYISMYAPEIDRAKAGLNPAQVKSVPSGDLWLEICRIHTSHFISKWKCHGHW